MQSPTHLAPTGTISLLPKPPRLPTSQQLNTSSSRLQQINDSTSARLQQTNDSYYSSRLQQIDVSTFARLQQSDVSTFSRLQQCGCQRRSEPETRVTPTLSARQCYRCFQSFTMWRRHSYLCRQSRKHRHSSNSFCNTFRKASVRWPSCSKHRKHISNRGRRKSILWLGDKIFFNQQYQCNKTEPMWPLSDGHASKHSNEQRDLSARPGHVGSHGEGAALVRFLLRVAKSAESFRIVNQQIPGDIPREKLIQSSTYLRPQCSNYERSHQRPVKLPERSVLL
uniref:Uncharacterized protein n=1 Tax=Cacopsylla melanoneura TaxID=428564 RepID=A0A8D8WLJ4_9HEMI